MNNKERVLKSLKHEEPDRVPIFYWGVPEFTKKMMDQLGFSIMDELLEFLDIDFRWVEPLYVGPDLTENSKIKKKDIWGIEYKLINKVNMSYWDIVKSPLDGITDIAVLDDYPWPKLNYFDFKSLHAQLKKYKDYAIITAPGYASPGLFRIIQRLVGDENFLNVMMYHPKFFTALVEKVSTFYCEFIAAFFKESKNKVDFIRIADDYGTPCGLIVSDDIWIDILRPVLERYLEYPKKYAVKFYMHSCGALRKLLPEFISLGVDVLAPIQTKAIGMSAEGLKKDFGNLISFSGALDEDLLLEKSPKQVKEEVKELLDIMAPGGGFIMGPSQKIKIETPVENVLAMYEAAREWKY